MPLFIIRVEFDGKPTSEEYEELHEAMVKAGYLRTIKQGSKDYHLPLAMYSTTSSSTTAKLSAEVAGILDGIHKPAEILTMNVSDFAGRLRPVQ